MSLSTPIVVRGYELDVQGHLNQAVYLQYAEHARWEALQAAGLTPEALSAARVGPVVLETTIRYLRELRLGDKVQVTCNFEWGNGKTFLVRQQIRKLDDGDTLCAEIEGRGGLMNLDARKLVADPQAQFRKLATDPSLLALQ